MKKIRWGILSSANIAITKVIPAIITAPNSELYAIASRTQASADAAAAQFGGIKAHASYQALLEDPEVDAIYNPLPNHLHVEWSLKALAAGKHVLCEKPLGLDREDAARLAEAAAAAPDCKVMEAFMYRFHPQWALLDAEIKAGSLGQIRSIHAHFSYNNRDAANIRNLKSMGGGALLDIGCYCISVSRMLFAADPLQVVAQVQAFADQEVDCLTSGLLQFAEGIATFTCATKVQPHQRVEIFGEAGRATIEIPFNPPLDAPAQITLYSGETRRELASPAVDQYALMVEAFADAILHDRPVPTPLSDALANMRVIDAIFDSIDTQSWRKIAL